MANSTAAKTKRTDAEPTKQQLQRQMARTRESLAQTVGEIKETVEQEVKMVKKGVSSVLDYRHEFQKDPLVWSLGALSAGFALGYTVGYAHKNTKGKKQNEITAFADTMIEQLSTMGQGLVMPALDAKISELFGFEFSALLEQAGNGKRPAAKKRIRRAAPPKKSPGRMAKRSHTNTSPKRKTSKR
jgi:hypothetical protein